MSPMRPVLMRSACSPCPKLTGHHALLGSIIGAEFQTHLPLPCPCLSRARLQVIGVGHRPSPQVMAGGNNSLQQVRL